MMARLPGRRGIRILLWLSDRVAGLTLSTIKANEGDLHPKHRLTDLHAFFLNATPEGSRVLDIGCAYGRIARSVADKADRVVAIDLRESAIERARRESEHPNVEYRIVSFEDFVADEPFDMVIASNVLEHIDERIEFLRKCRSLAPILALRVPAVDRDWIVEYKRELGLPWKMHAGHLIEYTQPTLTGELEEAGYRVEVLYAKYGALHCVARADN